MAWIACFFIYPAGCPGTVFPSRQYCIRSRRLIDLIASKLLRFLTVLCLDEESVIHVVCLEESVIHECGSCLRS